MSLNDLIKAAEDANFSDAHIGSLLRRQYLSTIREAAATIDKLPKTADGVPVVPGMEIYEVAYICGKRKAGSWQALTIGVPPFGGGANQYQHSYSTAEAAMKDHDDANP